MSPPGVGAGAGVVPGLVGVGVAPGAGELGEPKGWPKPPGLEG